MLVLYGLIVFGAAFLVAGYIFAEKPVVLSPSNRLYQLFIGKEYQKLMQQLDKNSKAILIGNRKDGLYIFIDYYASLKTKEGFQIKKRLFEPEEDLKY